MFTLGDEVKDKVSGLIGIVVSRIEYLNGCIQYGVTPKLKKGDTDILTWNIDEEQLESVKKKVVKVKKSPTGGSTNLAKSRH